MWMPVLSVIPANNTVKKARERTTYARRAFVVAEAPTDRRHAGKVNTRTSMLHRARKRPAHSACTHQPDPSHHRPRAGVYVAITRLSFRTAVSRDGAGAPLCKAV